MKKKLTALFIALSIFIVPVAVMVPQPAGAVDVLKACKDVTGAGKTAVCEDKQGKGNVFIRVLKVVIQLLAIVVGFAAVVVLILSALKMIWAQGDPAGIKSGREGVIAAIVGIVVAALAQAVVTFVLGKV